MNRALSFLYGSIAYGVFFVTFLYLIGFVGNMVVPKSIDSGPVEPLGKALLIDFVLVGLFAIQHSVMARPAFKAQWTRIVPKPIERSTYVLATCLCLVLMFWQWRPIPTTVWEVRQPLAWAALTGLSFLGWATVLYSSCLIDHFDLFGLRQVYLHLRNRPYSHPRFVARSLYRVVRHPLMIGFLIAIWFTPSMTTGHLLFSVLLTGYIAVGVTLEERDLATHLGPAYDMYRMETPMVVPTFFRRRRESGGPA